MSTTQAPVVTVVDIAKSHVLLLSLTTEMLRWFEQAVAGTAADKDIELKLAELDARLAEDALINQRLVNEWGAFKKSLSESYATFGRDVVHRLGVDETSHVRNFALNCAGAAFTRVRNAARDFLISQVEGGAPTGK